MDALQKVNKDVKILFNITDVLTQHLKYHQIYTYACTVLAYLNDCLTCMRQVATHTGLCQCSYDQYAVTRYTPCRRTQKYAQTHWISPTFNNAFTHVIGWHTPFLPVSQDMHADSRWTIFIAHRFTYTGQSTTTPNIWDLQPTSSIWCNVLAQYKIDNKYIGIIYDKTQAVMITEQQYSMCLHVNGQFCKIDAPFQFLTGLSSCIMALYTKNNHEIGVQCSLTIFYPPTAFSPIVIRSNLWIFILTPSVQGSAITMICPDKVTSSL